MRTLTQDGAGVQNYDASGYGGDQSYYADPYNAYGAPQNGQWGGGMPHNMGGQY